MFLCGEDYLGRTEFGGNFSYLERKTSMKHVFAEEMFTSDN